jgi:hypothetical protein
MYQSQCFWEQLNSANLDYSSRVLRLNQSKAMAVKAAGRVDTDFTSTLFGQVRLRSGNKAVDVLVIVWFRVGSSDHPLLYYRVPKFSPYDSVCCACAQRPGLPRVSLR